MFVSFNPIDYVQNLIFAGCAKLNKDKQLTINYYVDIKYRPSMYHEYWCLNWTNNWLGYTSPLFSIIFMIFLWVLLCSTNLSKLFSSTTVIFEIKH